MMILFSYKLNLFCIGGIADSQCCDCFRWTAKELSHIYACNHSPPNPPSHSDCHIMLSSVPCEYSRSLLLY